MNENMATCDYCEVEFDLGDRHVAALPRPSDPSEIVAVMWACPSCGVTEKLPTAKAVIEAVESGKEWDGRRYLFVTV